MTIREAFELNIFSLPGLRDLPFAEKETLSDQMSREILAGAAEEIAGRLPEDKAEEFAELFSSPHTPQERAKFLNDHVPDFEEILVRETLLFKEGLKNYIEKKVH